MTPETRLRQAAARGDIKAATNALARGAKINSVDAEGYSALHWAACNNHPEIVTLLLKHKDLDIDAKNCFGNTARMVAVRQQHGPIVAMLDQARPTFVERIMARLSATPDVSKS